MKKVFLGTMAAVALIFAAWIVMQFTFTFKLFNQLTTFQAGENAKDKVQEKTKLDGGEITTQKSPVQEKLKSLGFSMEKPHRISVR